MKQYEPCEHRHPYNKIGSEEPVYYDTPCEKCEAEDSLTAWIVGIFLAVVVVAAVAAVAWSVS